MMMSLLERLNHAFSGGIMFVQPTAETQYVTTDTWRGGGQIADY